MRDISSSLLSKRIANGLGKRRLIKEKKKSNWKEIVNDIIIQVISSDPYKESLRATELTLFFSAMLKLSKQAILFLHFKYQEQKLSASVGLEHCNASLKYPASMLQNIQMSKHSTIQQKFTLRSPFREIESEQTVSHAGSDNYLPKSCL